MDRASAVSPSPVLPIPGPIPGVVGVVRAVFDGDTILVRIGGKDETVRIIGMDSPEVHKPETPTECFATEATAAARLLLATGSRVTLQDDPTQGARDRFGRRLAHVILPDGVLFAERMIRDGYAIHYVYDRVPSIYADRLSAAQRAARDAGVGLWSPLTCRGDPHAPSAAPAHDTPAAAICTIEMSKVVKSRTAPIGRLGRNPIAQRPLELVNGLDPARQLLTT